MDKSEHIITLRHYLVLCVSAFTAGIYAAVAFGRGTSVTAAIFLCALIAVLAVRHIIIPLIKHKKVSLKKPVLLPAVLILFTLFGMFYVTYTELTAFRAIRQYSGKSVWLTGTVASVPQLSDSGYTYSFTLDVSQLEYQGETRSVNGSVFINIGEKRGERLSFGDHIQCWTALDSPSEPKFENEFDFSTYLRGKNTFLTGKTKSFNPISRKAAPHSAFSDIKLLGIFINRKITDAANALFSYSTDDRAALKGILTGDKSEFSDSLREQFSNAGISHIAAVSGMHMSMLFAAFTYLISFAKLNRKTVLALSLPVILMFTSTAAFTPSVCRSALMLVVMILSVLISEDYSPVTALFLALGIILLVSPYSLFSPSLVLSFSATIGIIVYFEYFSHFISKALPIRFAADSLALSLSTFIGTAYFTAVFFERISFVQLLTNLWIIPIVTIVFCFGYLSCIFYYIMPQLSYMFLRYPVAGGLRVITLTAKFFGNGACVVNMPPAFSRTTAFAISLCASVMLYLLLKTFYDMSPKSS